MEIPLYLSPRMNAGTRQTVSRQLNERLADSGFRFTPQREHVYNVLLARRDHPTADEVYLRGKRTMPDISMATVYNCLDALVKSGLVRQVQIDRGATRYCPNMKDHGHFLCDDCGGIFDLDLEISPRTPVTIPAGFQPQEIVVSVRGRCPDCSRVPARRSPGRE